MATAAYLDYGELLRFAGATFHEERDVRFVTSPGVKLISTSQPTPEFACAMDPEHDDSDSDWSVRSGEFKARLCYMAFPETVSFGARDEDQAKSYVRAVCLNRGHLSVWNAWYAEFLICGISVETMIELLAHTEAKTSRMTTSKTAAQLHPSYRLSGTEAQMGAMKEIVLRWVDTRKAEGRRGLTMEQSNMLNPGIKCGALTFCMSLKDYARFLRGRTCVEGNETEVREVALEMLRQLNTSYPAIFSELAEERGVTKERGGTREGDCEGACGVGESS